jgi:hypothetical protein
MLWYIKIGIADWFPDVLRRMGFAKYRVANLSKRKLMRRLVLRSPK